MSSSKIILIIFALALGIGLGLFYGWNINPVQYTDVTPDILRQDYRVDYVLMVAEAYQSDFDADTAAHRLAILGSESPAEITSSAMEYATHNGFTEKEISDLQNLLTSMQTYQQSGNIAP